MVKINREIENMKYKVGDRVRIKSLDWYNENKDEDGNIRYKHGTVYPIFFTKYMSRFCGETVTIKCVHEKSYYMNETGSCEFWTDEMIECKVEEECPQDFIEKYCISCGTQRCDRTKEYLNGCPYYNAYMCIKQNNDMEEEMSLDKAGQITDFEYEGLEYTLPEGYMFKDENGNVISTTKIVLERKKKEYPKTYGYCCDTLDCCSYNVGFDRCETPYDVTLHNKLLALRKLLICRDAYWKIAGEEMGLDKPWKPDWNDKKQDKHGFYNEIKNTIINSKVFVFPTAKMRDAFYENFKEEIEICKELL